MDAEQTLVMFIDEIGFLDTVWDSCATNVIYQSPYDHAKFLEPASDRQVIPLGLTALPVDSWKQLHQKLYEKQPQATLIFT
eukprot:5378514-Amphidinium_carterae.2